jgi:hypothetical protein
MHRQTVGEKIVDQSFGHASKGLGWLSSPMHWGHEHVVVNQAQFWEAVMTVASLVG